MNSFTKKLDSTLKSIATYQKSGDAAKVATVWRDILHLFQVESRNRPDPEPDTKDSQYRRLFEAAKQAMFYLGGQGDFALTTVADYDHKLYGPFLGVSDNGSATKAIRQGAMASPKCEILGAKRLNPLTIGVSHDAERLGAVGEVVVGPDEYANIRLACRDRLLTTTNIGTRANVRYFHLPPVVELGGADFEQLIESGVDGIKREFSNYLPSELGKGRKMTVFVKFTSSVNPQIQLRVLKELARRVDSRELSRSKKHQLGWLAQLKNRSVDEFQGIAQIAKQTGITHVAVEGSYRKAAQDAISLPGLLNFYTPEDLTKVLSIAANQGLHVTTLCQVDPQTTARHIWTGLCVARSMGVDLGKYGTVPLSMAEQKEVVARIQHWLPFWCAAPVYYIDQPLVADREVFHEPNLVAGIKQWLEMVAILRVKVVLIDTANKSEKRKLLKTSPTDKVGFLSLEQVAELTKLGESKRIKILWAGGISLPQAYDLGKLGVFGMYVTSEAAETVALDNRSRRDPYLVTARRPESKAVARVKLLIEAGFLAGQGHKQIDSLAQQLLDSDTKNKLASAEQQLFNAVSEAWKVHFSQCRIR
jgi:hypothetical protein